MKKVLILGSTGSIGENALKVISSFPDKFKVVGLVASRNVNRIKEQIEKFRPEAVCLTNYDGKLESTRFFKGLAGLKELIDWLDFDVAISAISGSDGILPTYWLSLKGKRIALANKESLVCAGDFIVNSSSEIIPVDSEHSAIFQSLMAGRKDDVDEIILTASGGPFFGRKDLSSVTPEEALKHPNWDMGTKVTIDSATLMNKGLEVIEAYWLFRVPIEKIRVVIHPESIVHSMVKFKDKSFISQLGKPDMRIPIAYALSFPERLPLDSDLEVNFSGKKLTFHDPDTKTFRCLSLAYESFERGYPFPIVLNAADEVAVRLFLEGKIKFTQIPEIIERTLERANFVKPSTIDDVIKINENSLRLAEEIARCL